MYTNTSNKWQSIKGLKEYKYNSTTVEINRNKPHYDIKINIKIFKSWRSK